MTSFPSDDASTSSPSTTEAVSTINGDDKVKEKTPSSSASESPPAPKRTAFEVIQQNGNVAGRRFVITGAYSGVGAALTRAILKAGGKVVMGGRDRAKLEAFLQQLRDCFGDDVTGFVLDLADLKSVQEFAKGVHGKFAHIDVLINNAGVMNCPPSVTNQGLERQMGINVVGHFLLSKLLVENTKRQVWLSSTAHAWFGGPRLDIEATKKFSLKDTSQYSGSGAYQQSKLGCILLAKEFHKRYRIETASCHPGVIMSSLFHHMSIVQFTKFTLTSVPTLFAEEGILSPTKSPDQGASTPLTVATLPSDQLKNGGYYKDCVVAEETEAAQNMVDAKTLFDYCDEVTKPFFVELRFL